MWIRKRSSFDTVHSHRFEDLDNGDFDKKLSVVVCLFVLLSGSGVGRWPRRPATAAGKVGKGRCVCGGGLVGGVVVVGL